MGGGARKKWKSRPLYQTQPDVYGKVKWIATSERVNLFYLVRIKKKNILNLYFKKKFANLGQRDFIKKLSNDYYDNILSNFQKMTYSNSLYFIVNILIIIRSDVYLNSFEYLLGNSFIIKLNYM